MSLPELYRQVVLEHNRAPRNRGIPEPCSHSAEGLNALCGDHLWLHLHVDADRVLAAGFTGEACAISTACASLLTEFAQGRSPRELAEAYGDFQRLLSSGVEHPDLADFNALAEVRRHPGRIQCATLPWVTLLEAVGAESTANRDGD